MAAAHMLSVCRHPMLVLIAGCPAVVFGSMPGHGAPTSQGPSTSDGDASTSDDPTNPSWRPIIDKRKLYPAGRILHMVPVHLMPSLQDELSQAPAPGITSPRLPGSPRAEGLSNLNACWDSNVPVSTSGFEALSRLGSSMSMSSAEGMQPEAANGRTGELMQQQGSGQGELPSSEMNDFSSTGFAPSLRKGCLVGALHQHLSVYASCCQRGWCCLGCVATRCSCSACLCLCAGASVPSASASSPQAAVRKWVLLEDMPHEAYGRMKVCRTMLQDHFIPSYNASLQSSMQRFLEECVHLEVADD